MSVCIRAVYKTIRFEGMSPHETSSNVEDMHALLHELNSLNELHAPDHCELFGMGSVTNFVRNAGNTLAAKTGYGNTKNAAAAETKWSKSTDIAKRAIMSATLTSLLLWIAMDTTNAADVEKLKENLYHMSKVDMVWIEKVNSPNNPEVVRSSAATAPVATVEPVV